MRKQNKMREIFVYDMKMHSIIISFQKVEKTAWLFLLGISPQSPIYNSTTATEFMDSYTNTYTFLFYLYSHIHWYALVDVNKTNQTQSTKLW